MPEDPNNPVPASPESPRAVYQALAERLRVLAPGASLSDEMMAFAEAVARRAVEASGTPGNGPQRPLAQETPPSS